MEDSQNPKLINALIKLHLSNIYPILFALFCTISALSNKYVFLPIILVLTASVVFCAFFVKDSKIFLIPIFMMYCSLGADTEKAYITTGGDVFASIDGDAWLVITAVALLIAIALMIRFFCDGTFKYAFKNRGKAFLGIILIDAVFLTNGILSPTWSLQDLLRGALMALGLTLLYLLLRSLIMRADGDIISYVCKIMLITSFMILGQVVFNVIKLIRTNEFIIYNEWSDMWSINRAFLNMSWGIVTVIGGMMIIGIPAALYLAKDKKCPVFYCLCALILTLTTFFMNARSAMIASTLIFVIGMILLCISGKNRVSNRIFASSLLLVSALAAIGVYIYLCNTETLDQTLKKLTDFLRLNELYIRFNIVKLGFRHFLEYPIFGVGLSGTAGSAELMQGNFYANMYHNIMIQFAAGFGCIGILAFLFHIKDIMFTAFKQPNVGRSVLLLVPAAVLLMSLVDNFFFYPNFQIFYLSFIILAEKDMEKADQHYA